MVHELIESLLRLGDGEELRENILPQDPSIGRVLGRPSGGSRRRQLGLLCFICGFVQAPKTALLQAWTPPAKGVGGAGSHKDHLGAVLISRGLCSPSQKKEEFGKKGGSEHNPCMWLRII